MARVKIDSGALSPTYRFRDIPKERWDELVWEKRNFLATKINYDCRCLIEFCDEANAVWSDLGYESAADMIRNGYELDPQQIELAVAWLKINEPDAAVGIDDVSKKVAEAREKPIAKVGKPVGAKGGNQHTANVDNINKSEQVKGGTSAEYLLRRLARDCPEMLDRIEAGELSVHAAAIKAGIRKVKSPDEKAVAAWDKAVGRLTVLRHIFESLSPHEIATLTEWMEH